MSRKTLIPKADLGLYQPGTIVVTSVHDLYFLAAALSDEREDVMLSRRKYADQGEAYDFAEQWFERNEP